MLKRQGQWLLIHYTIKKKIMVCRVVGDRGQLMVRQNALKIRSWADVFGLERWSDHCGVDLLVLLL